MGIAPGVQARPRAARSFRRRLSAFAASTLLVALAAPAASPAHHGDDLSPAGATEADLRAIETALLGPEHAAEHAAARTVLRRAARGNQTETTRAAISYEGAPTRAAGPRSEVGAWTRGPFALPTYAIHAALLPTGKMLFWGRPPAPTEGDTWANLGDGVLWAPWLGTGPHAFTDVAPPVIDVDGPGGQEPAPAPIFCSGLSLLPNGEVAVAGGNLIYPGTFPDDEYTNWGGLQTLFTFDPWSETWTRQPDMAEGRWYPTQTLLPDGRTIIAGGLSEEPPGGLLTDSVEVFNPPAQVGGQGTVIPQPTADRAGLGLYPRMFSFGDDLIVTGPSKALTATLDTTSFTWDESLQTMSRTRAAGNAVRRPGGPSGSNAFTTLGGVDRTLSPGPFYAATETSETIDLDGSATWSDDTPLNVARANANTVLLPDGSMVEVGGGSGVDDGGLGIYATYEDGSARQIEIYDPDADRWLLGPAQEEDRTYHSTALLLPNGRVFSAGDDRYPIESDGGFSLTDSAEIYSPPYLFKGPRPVIDSAPQAVDWGDSFGVESSAGVERAVLMAPGATTHAFDMSQRHVELELLDDVAGKGVNLVAPPSANVAPEGYYMLFLLDDAGVPSKASWVRIDPTAPHRRLLASRDPCKQAKAKLKRAKRKSAAARKRLWAARRSGEQARGARVKRKLKRAQRRVRRARRAVKRAC